MKIALGIAFVLIGVILLCVEIYLLYVCLSFRPSCCKKCNGFLQSQKYNKEQKVGYFLSKKIVKDYREFVYVYRVNNVKYSKRGMLGRRKNSMPTIVEVTYQKANPKRAYIADLTSPMYFEAFVIIFPFVVLFFVCGVGLII